MTLVVLGAVWVPARPASAQTPSLHLSATVLPPLSARVLLDDLGPRFVAGDLTLRQGREVRWWLWLREQREAAAVIRLREENLRDAASLARRAGMAADVRALTVPHERWTSLSVRRAFDHGSIEAGLEGLTSEPMAAIDRRGRAGPASLRRAGAVIGARLGSPSRIASVFELDARAATCASWAPAMVVRGHARRWLGHGQRPVMDVRWRADGALTHVHRQSGIISQWRSTATWRHVVGERGQVLQVGSFPVARESAGPSPHVLYEPIVGYEDLARFTAHVFSVSSRAEVRRRQVSLGAFVNVTQIDHARHANRDTWLLATGPSIAAKFRIAGQQVLFRWQSARRISAESSPWLHLLTAGV